MSNAHAFPADYRAREIQALLTAIRAGECAALAGLSGAGKSNVLRCLAETQSNTRHPLVLVDANRLAAPTAEALFDLMRRALAEADDATLDALVSRRLHASESSLTFLIDRFDALAQAPPGSLYGPLRALRDTHKYRLTYVIAARRPLPAANELAELFFGNTLWLGPLSDGDARWTVARYAARKGLSWDTKTAEALIALTRGYPSFLRAACEALAGSGAGAALTTEALAAHPAMQARLAEFWADSPSPDELRACGLAGLPLLSVGRSAPAPAFDTSKLTAKEALLLEHFLAHPHAVCAKDELIRAVWPEDKVFTDGVRDDSLAQLVRRLREKIEPDPARPRHVLTVPGRGYRFEP